MPVDPKILAPNLFLCTDKTHLTREAKFRKIAFQDLGSGGTGVGTKFLADDMTWKTVSSTGGSESFHPFLLMGG